MIQNDDDTGGHYVVSGTALAGLGVLAMLISASLGLLHAELHFIDAQAMSVIGLGFFLIGGGMLLHGRRLTHKS